MLHLNHLDLRPLSISQPWSVDNVEYYNLNHIGENHIGENHIGENRIDENRIGENHIGENHIDILKEFGQSIYNYTGLNELLNFFSWFTIAPPNNLILGSKHHWSAKGEKSIMWEVVARRCSAKKLS